MGQQSSFDYRPCDKNKSQSIIRKYMNKIITTFYFTVINVSSSAFARKLHEQDGIARAKCELFKKCQRKRYIIQKVPDPDAFYTCIKMQTKLMLIRIQVQLYIFHRPYQMEVLLHLMHKVRYTSYYRIGDNKLNFKHIQELSNGNVIANNKYYQLSVPYTIWLSLNNFYIQDYLGLDLGRNGIQENTAGSNNNVYACWSMSPNI